MSVAQFDVVRDEVAVTADAFMAEFTDWAGDRYRSVSAEDMRAAAAAVAEQLLEVAPAARVRTFEAAVAALFSEGERFVRSQPPGSVWTVDADRLEPVWAALDDALAPFEDRLLDDARSQVEEAERQLRVLQQQLEAAIAAGDVDAVRRLREQVEFDGPNKLADARVKVRQLEVARAQAVLERPAARAAIVSAQWERAKQVLEDTQQALAAAETAWRAAREATVGPFRVRDAALRRVQAIEKSAGEQAAADVADRQARVLQLAGIPAGTTADALSTATRNRHFEAEQLRQTRAAFSAGWAGLADDEVS